MAEAAPETLDAQEIGENAGLISILAIGRHSLGRDLRLKTEDVITAIDGEPITYDVDKFDKLIRDYKDLPALLTIFRDGKLFDIFVNGPLGCSYKYADEPTILAVNSAMQGREKSRKIPIINMRLCVIFIEISGFILPDMSRWRPSCLLFGCFIGACGSRWVL